MILHPYIERLGVRRSPRRGVPVGRWVRSCIRWPRCRSMGTNRHAQLAGKVAFIFGCRSVGDDPDAKVWGNGKAHRRALARQGARIYGVDLRKEAADDDQGHHRQGRRHLRHARRRDDEGEEVEVAVATGEGCGRIDILVNNVGGSAPGDAVTTTSRLGRQLEHNLKTVSWGCRRVGDEQGNGAIVYRLGRRSAHHPRSRPSLIDRPSRHSGAFSKSTAIPTPRKGIR